MLSNMRAILADYSVHAIAQQFHRYASSTQLIFVTPNDLDRCSSRGKDISAIAGFHSYPYR
ncbi:hypothetical protein [Tumidithrix helvetica]|uniref:hypothetical protein n=1 Tax=Tumidithrix helvetica TaxID=3457545 RepID=UPI003CC584A4